MKQVNEESVVQKVSFVDIFPAKSIFLDMFSAKTDRGWAGELMVGVRRNMIIIDLTEDYAMDRELRRRKISLGRTIHMVLQKSPQ